VKLEPCALPNLDLGAGETLETLHHIDLSQDWDAAIHQLLRAIESSNANAVARPRNSEANSVVPPKSAGVPAS